MHHDYKCLARGNIERESPSGRKTRAVIGKIVLLDVSRVKATQVSKAEDVETTRRCQIHRHACCHIAGVSKCVRIVAPVSQQVLRAGIDFWNCAGTGDAVANNSSGHSRIARADAACKVRWRYRAASLGEVGNKHSLRSCYRESKVDCGPTNKGGRSTEFKRHRIGRTITVPFEF